MKIEWLKRAGFRRLAGGAAALILVAGAGASSAAFVDYLADRAKLRAYAAATEKKPAEQVRPEQTEPAAAVETAALPARPKPVKADAAAITKMAKTAAAAAQKLPGKNPSMTAAATSRSPTEAVAVPPTGTVMAALKPQPDRKPEPTVAGYVDPHDTYTGAIATPPQAYAPVAATGVTQPSPEQETSVRTATVKEHVNLRSGPADESKVLTVVPAKASVNVLSCDSWCEVEYAGTKGFIYKRFIGNS